MVQPVQTWREFLNTLPLTIAYICNIRIYVHWKRWFISLWLALFFPFLSLCEDKAFSMIYEFRPWLNSIRMCPMRQTNMMDVNQRMKGGTVLWTSSHVSMRNILYRHKFWLLHHCKHAIFWCLIVSEISLDLIWFDLNKLYFNSSSSAKDTKMTHSLRSSADEYIHYDVQHDVICM